MVWGSMGPVTIHEDSKDEMLWRGGSDSELSEAEYIAKPYSREGKFRCATIERKSYFVEKRLTCDWQWHDGR